MKVKFTKMKEGVKMNDCVNFINTCGFPIAMCIGMGYYLVKKDEAHNAESKEFTEALNKNTLVLQKLCERLDMEEVQENEQ